MKRVLSFFFLFFFPKVFSQSSYDKVNHDYDIAIVKLSQGVFLNDNIKTINLPKGNNDLAGNNKFAVTGFGRTSPDDGQSNLLLKAPIPIMSDGRCGQLSYHHS